MPEEDIKNVKGYESFAISTLGSMGYVRRGRLSYAKLRQIYDQTSAVRAAVDSIVREVVTLPWEVVPRTPNFNPSHAYAIEEFLLNPNVNDEAFGQLLSKVLTDLLVYDVGVIEKVRNLRGGLVELFARDASTFTVLVDNHGVITGYRQDVSGKETVEFDPDDVIYLVLHPNTDTPYGAPILESIVDEVATFLFTNSYIARSFTEDELPQGILSIGPIGEEAVKQLKADFKARRTDRYSLRVVHDEQTKPSVEWVQFKRPNREMQLDELRQSIERIIFRAFGVTPLEVGMTADINRSTALQQRMVAEKRRIIPIVNMLGYYINTEIVWSEFGFKDVAFRFKFTPTKDVLAEARALEYYVRSGIMSRNEARTKLDLSPVPGGDGFVMVAGGNVIPLPYGRPSEAPPQEEEATAQRRPILEDW